MYTIVVFNNNTLLKTTMLTKVSISTIAVTFVNHTCHLKLVVDGDIFDFHMSYHKL